MKITLITAAYNSARTIGDTIDSVARQRYANREHLIIDGASADETLAVVNARRHAAMRVVSEPDKGVYDAINKGIALAGGDVVGLVHSDDFLPSEDVLSRIAEAFAEDGVGGVYGDLDYVARHDVDRIVRRWRSGEFSHAKLRRGWMPPHPTLFLRKEILLALGGYDTRYRIASDYDFILRLLGRNPPLLKYLPVTLVKMRLGGLSNGSLKQVIRKSAEDYRAIRTNGIGGVATLLCKNARKLPQFFG